MCTQIHRRDLFRLFGAAAATAGLGGMPASAMAVDVRSSDDWLTAFNEALAEKPWLAGYKGVTDPRLETAALRVEGRLPSGLRGDFWRNGPAHHEPYGLRYHHWFDGDGMVQRFRFDGAGGVSHLGRFVETAKVKAERAAGRALITTFGTDVPDARRVGSPDAVNVANISVVDHGGRLMALWEAGSPHELDRDALDTLGPVHWSPKSAGVPFSAHPRLDRDGSLWNFGAAGWMERLFLWRIGPDGALKSIHSHAVPQVGMPHDFVLTERHLVVPLPPFAMGDGPMKGAFLDMHDWNPTRPTRLFFVAKDNPDDARFAELPPGWIFHFGNAWEDKDGVIRFDASWYDDTSVMTGTLRDVMRGHHTPTTNYGLAMVRLDTRTGRAEIEVTRRPAEFPRIDPRRATLRNRFLYILTDDGPREMPGFHKLARLDLEGGAEAVFDFGPGMVAEEHLFVPRPGSVEEGDGWLMGTVLDIRAQVTRLTIFDARNLSAGPLAVVSLPYVLPLGFHGTFSPA